MSEIHGNDGSTNVSDEERKRVDELGDGSPHGNTGDADAASGGAPEAPDTEEQVGTPVENPSG